MLNIAGDEVALAALKSLAQNKKISAICLEQHDKGLGPDYEAIRARVLKEDEVLPIDKIGVRKYSSTVHMSSPIIAACYTPPIQSQNFGNINSLPKDHKSVGGQADPSRAEFKEKHVAQMDKIKPKLTGNSVNEFTTPTLEELPAEYRQADEALKKSRGE